MRSFSKALFTAIIALAVAASAHTALAADPAYGTTPKYTNLSSCLFKSHQPKLPTFQAAPWYLYWPYDGHFLTPAPIAAPFIAPPVNGNFPVNPYFPAPTGYYGPIPGGAAPSGIPAGSGGLTMPQNLPMGGRQ